MIEPVSPSRQRARALFILMASGQAMMALEDFVVPEEVATRKRVKGVTERVMKWHSRLCSLIGASGKLPPINARTVENLLQRFQTHIPQDSDRSEKAAKMRVAAFCATAWFLLDLMVCCGDIVKDKGWKFFERAVNELDLILCAACDPGDAGADLYLELVW